MTAYDGTVQQDWTIDNRTLWKPWHSRKAEYALPWEAPTGAHDMYKAGEYMIWTDGSVKKCVQDTNFSPIEYPQAWEDAQGRIYMEIRARPKGLFILQKIYRKEQK